MAQIAPTNISVTASAGDVKPTMDAVQKALDQLSAAPLEKLRDKSEASLQRINTDVALTVSRLDQLKKELADTGGVNTRLLKSVEKDFGRFKNLGVDSQVLSGLAGQIQDVGGKADFIDPEVAAWKKLESERVIAAEERAKRIEAIDRELADRSARVLETLKSREIAAQRRAAAAVDGIHKEFAEKELARLNTLEGEYERQRQVFLQTARASATTPAGRGSAAGGRGAAGLGSRGIAGAIDDLIGGKFDIGKGAKFGIAGILAGFISDTVNDITRGAVEGRNNGDGVLVGAAKSLPILNGIAGSIENIHELWTGARRDAEAYSRILDYSNETAKRHNDLLERQSQFRKDIARQSLNSAEEFAASQRGGAFGRTTQLVTQQAIQQRNNEARRDEIKRLRESADAQIKENEKRIQQIQSFDPQFRESKGTQMSVATLRETSAIQDRNRQITQELAQKERELNAEIARTNTEIERLDVRIDQSKGLLEFTADVENSIDNLNKRIRTMDGDPIRQMRKEFDELNPTSRHLAEFNTQLERFAKAQKEADKQARAYAAGQEIDRRLEEKSVAGLSEIDAQIQRYTEAGVDGERVKRIRIDLETKGAKQAAADLGERLADTQAQIDVASQRDPLSRIRAEVFAENARNIRSRGISLSGDQIEQDVQSRRSFQLAQEASSIRESIKTPFEKLADDGRELQEQFKRGFLSKDEADRAAAKLLGDFNQAPRPELLEVGTAAADRMLAVASGEVYDSSNPQLQVQKDMLAVLTKILEKPPAGTRVAIQNQ